MLRIRKSLTGSGPAPGETRAVGAPEPADLASILARIESRIDAVAKALEEAGLEVVETEIPTALTPAADAPAVHPLTDPQVKAALGWNDEHIAELERIGITDLETIAAMDPDQPDQRLLDLFGPLGAKSRITKAKEVLAGLSQ